MVCRQCGIEIADKALICYKCGTATTERRVQPVALSPGRPAWLVPVVAAVVVVAALVAAAWWFGLLP